MNEQHFAYKVERHLNRGLHELPAATVHRLAGARRRRWLRRSRQFARLLWRWQAVFVQHHFENLRFRQLLITLALAAGVVTSAFWLADMHISEQGAIDSELLSDELPK